MIADLADSFFPLHERTKSRNEKNTGHDGIFFVKPRKVSAYVEVHQPQIAKSNDRLPRGSLVHDGSERIVFEAGPIFAACARAVSNPVLGRALLTKSAGTEWGRRCATVALTIC